MCIRDRTVCAPKPKRGARIRYFYPRGTIRSRICVLCHPTKPPPARQTPQWFRLRDDAYPQQRQFPIYPSIHPPRSFLQMTLIPQICWPYRESDDKDCGLSRQLLLNKGNSLCVIAPPYPRSPWRRPQPSVTYENGLAYEQGVIYSRVFEP